MYILACVSGDYFRKPEKMLDILLQPLVEFWQYCDFTPLQLLKLVISDGVGHDESKAFWKVFNAIKLFEAPLNRTEDFNKSSSMAASHLMIPHLQWMIEPILKLLRSIHSIVPRELPEMYREAFALSPNEMVDILGKASHIPSQEDVMDVVPSYTVKKWANWMKSVKESSYMILGYAMRIPGHSFYQVANRELFLDSISKSLTKMEYRQLRQLIHSVTIPLVKTCPTECAEFWLSKHLCLLLKHCATCLIKSWDSSNKGDKSIVIPDIFPSNTIMDTSIEIAAEKILITLTSEVTYLLALITSPRLNKSIPCLEQGLNNTDIAMDEACLLSQNMISCLIREETTTFSAYEICTAAFKWTKCDQMRNITQFWNCMLSFVVATKHDLYQSIMADKVFKALINALRSNASPNCEDDMIMLCKDIFLHLSPKFDCPKTVLLDISASREAYDAFEANFSRMKALKKKKQVFKSFLLSLGIVQNPNALSE